MSWKRELQLRDIDYVERVEITCKMCGLFQPQDPQKLIDHFGLDMRLDEVEELIKCQKWGCGGDVRLTLPTENKLEGFQGGMP